MTHTPGPWILTKNPPHVGPPDPDFPPYWFIEGPNVERIPFLHIAAFLAEADAHLIAAAPELLEACKAALKYADATRDSDFDRQYIETEVMAALKAVIAKAEGRI